MWLGSQGVKRVWYWSRLSLEGALCPPPLLCVGFWDIQCSFPFLGFVCRCSGLHCSERS